MDIEKFKVLTLNCWGVFTPVVCEKRYERLSAIGDKLSEGEYDIILLQEIWTESDFENMKEKLKSIYQYHNYFHSNLIGSGCCIFTKFKIMNSFFYRFTLNGYPHYIHHGDWFGGKGIGMTTLELPTKNFRINVYVTHMHARYEHEEKNDQYYFHRMAQGYEMGEFIRLTSDSCDAVIVGGDFNMDQSMIGLNFLTANSGVKDAWIFRNNAPKYLIQDSATCDRPDNPYFNKKWNQWYPYGERLDYIFYKQNSCIKLVCTDCSLQMQSVPGCESMHYSDHTGVEACFEISHNALETADKIDEKKRVELCEIALSKLSNEFQRIESGKKTNLIFCILTLLCILFDFPNFIFVSLTYDNVIPTAINRLILSVLSILCFIYFWYFVAIKSNERKAMINFQESMRLYVNNANNTKEKKYFKSKENVDKDKII